jgi:hypothetical protein
VTLPQSTIRASAVEVLIGSLSTNAKSAPNNSGSSSVARLRPAPLVRTRPSPTTDPASSSCTPRRTVLRDIPVAAATALTPPRPNARAPAPANNRR